MNVLLGIGGSEDSFRALETALARVAEAGDTLTVAIVENPASAPTPADVESRVEAALADAGIEADIVRLEGHAGSRLTEYAEQGGYDRIVLGGGETSPLGKVQLGSIAEFVLLNATTSVTLIR